MQWSVQRLVEHPSGWLLSKIQKIARVNKSMEKLEPLCPVDGSINGTDDMENSMVVLPKLKIQLPHDPAIPLLCIYSKELKGRSQRDTNVPMSYSHVKFTIVKMWKQSKCPLIDEWISKIQNISTYNGILSSFKTKEILTHVTTWIRILC